MVGNPYYKKYINDLINQDSTTLEMSVETRLPDGYGGFTVTRETVQIVARLYKNSRRIQFLKDSGVVEGWLVKALVAGDVAINEGMILKSPQHSYKVVTLNTYFGICTQIELEVVE